MVAGNILAQILSPGAILVKKSEHKPLLYFLDGVVQSSTIIHKWISSPTWSGWEAIE